MAENNDTQELTSHEDQTQFIEKLLLSKGFMYIKRVSTSFPFSNTNSGFVYTFRCGTMDKISILNILNQIP